MHLPIYSRYALVVYIACLAWSPCAHAAWPSPLENHEGHEGAVVYLNYVGILTPGTTVTPGQFIWGESEENRTANSKSWTLSTTVSTTHTWNVSATVAASIKAGMLTKVITEANVNTGTSTAYTGSNTITHAITINTTIDPCRGMRREERIDVYNTTVTQTTADGKYVCVSHDFYTGFDNFVVHSGTGHGDKSRTGTFLDLGPLTQSVKVCFHCFKAP